MPGQYSFTNNVDDRKNGKTSHQTPPSKPHPPIMEKGSGLSICSSAAGEVAIRPEDRTLSPACSQCCLAILDCCSREFSAKEGRAGGGRRVERPSQLVLTSPHPILTLCCANAHSNTEIVSQVMTVTPEIALLSQKWQDASPPQSAVPKGSTGFLKVAVPGRDSVSLCWCVPQKFKGPEVMGSLGFFFFF